MFELDESRRDELAEAWAKRIVQRGLGTAAVFLLEAHKPLAGLGSHAVVAFQPLLRGILPWSMGEIAAFMHGSDNVERLIQRVEELEARRSDKSDAPRRRAAEVRRRARHIRALRRRRRSR